MGRPTVSFTEALSARSSIAKDERTPSTKENNKMHFDQIAHKYDRLNPLRKRILDGITDAILEQCEEFDEEEPCISVMEYACGTGLISQRLAPYCKELVGVDISPVMVDYFNQKVKNQGISPNEMRALCLDIESETQDNDGLEGFLFDVIVCSQGYHHFPNIDNVTMKLAQYLKAGTGVLVIVDLIKPSRREPNVASGSIDAHIHPHSKTVAHPGGFLESQITNAVAFAGLEDFQYRPFIRFKKHGEPLEMFIASGRRPNS